MTYRIGASYKTTDRLMLRAGIMTEAIRQLAKTGNPEWIN